MTTSVNFTLPREYRMYMALADSTIAFSVYDHTGMDILVRAVAHYSRAQLERLEAAFRAGVTDKLSVEKWNGWSPIEIDFSCISDEQQSELLDVCDTMRSLLQDAEMEAGQ